MPEQLVGEWRERAARLGFDRVALRAVLGRVDARRRAPADWVRAFRRLAAPTGLTHRRSTFAPRDVVQALCEAIPAGADVEVREFEAAAEEFLDSDGVLPVLDGDAGQAAPAIRLRDGRMVWARTDRRFSTVELLTVEQQVIGTALSGVGRGVATVAPQLAEAAITRRPFLSAEQQRMVRRLTGDGDTVAIVVGPAGTGKTVALQAAREAWEAGGIKVEGVAVARRAARELSDGAGIEATSVAAMLRRLRLGAEPLRRGSVPGRRRGRHARDAATRRVAPPHHRGRGQARAHRRSPPAPRTRSRRLLPRARDPPAVHRASRQPPAAGRLGATRTAGTTPRPGRDRNRGIPRTRPNRRHPRCGRTWRAPRRRLVGKRWTRARDHDRAAPQRRASAQLPGA